MSPLLVSDELWAVVEPLLPTEPAKPRGGHPHVSDRAALTGILFVLKSGIGWELLPQEMGCGSGIDPSPVRCPGIMQDTSPADNQPHAR